MVLFSLPNQVITTLYDNTISKSIRISSNVNNCQYCCCHFPKFVGSTFRSEKSNISEQIKDSEYKLYFELNSEEERLTYEHFKLLARVTYDEFIKKHRERALEQLHQFRLNVLLEELRSIEGTDILNSSSDECLSEFRIKIPENKKNLQIKNKKRRFRKQKIRK
ncbi:hypothetical protein PGB90_009354 [Kerria lacca]